MVTHKLSQVLAIVIAVAATVLFVSTLVIGNENIAFNVDGAQNETIVPLLYLAYAVFALTIGLVVIFAIVNMARNPQNIKSTLISVVALAVIVLVSYYGLATDSKPMVSDPSTVDSGSALMVGAGLWTLYIIVALAVIAIIWSFITKLLSR